MEAKKCPYPGLRPFTEGEAVYFKGRDSHIRQIIRQLEDNKIVIITGASGDGKSSLVYAGVIPNARAGFFRAKHNNWLVADFRPERNPLKNLSDVVAESLKIEPEATFDELSLGFSSLTDLYKSSKFHVDEDGEEWKDATLARRKELKAQAGNVLILADQFEEFFTNNENFSQGKPSNEAYTTINLLLETAEIALREDLPIYVVFTMRSDFISQCVAFKGLPEAIGFSQFFIPRLKRNELQQVIEEPAILSGATVSKRLTEVLINDLHEGFDRLPVLQHTLNQLWQMAKDGEESLDLIHLVKLAGMSSHLLPPTDQNDFNAWLKKQTPEHRKYFDAPELSNVLNTHANILHKQAWENYQKQSDWSNSTINEKDAQRIQKIAFQSLTKIDGGRAVRNRMTLREITEVINAPHIPYEAVCAVLNIFRLPDSTFIRPFIQGESLTSQYLAADTVLDITHEALIRNWKILEKWLQEEQSNYTDFLDFKVQLNRWLENNKKKEFLLSLGSLTFFKEWYERSTPNKYWVAKYDDSALSKPEKLEKAALMSENAAEFIEKSDNYIKASERKKWRIRMYAYAGSLFTIIALSVFSYWTGKEKAFAQEQQKIALEQTKLAKIEKNKAIAANQLAETEKQKAILSAKEALSAKQQSDSALVEADKQRHIAQEQTNIARQESQRALQQTELAEKERELAEQERQAATEQRKIAVVASDRAQQLSYLFMAQALAYKAVNDYKEPQINLLLAQQAYNFHTQYEGRDNSPTISSGMRIALNYAGYQNRIKTEAVNPIAFGVYQNKIFIAEQANRLLYYSDWQNQPKNEELKNKTVLSRSFFFKDFAVLTYENRRSSVLWYNKKSSRLKGHKAMLRCAAVSGNNDFLVTGARDGSIVLKKIEGLKTEAELQLGDKPTQLFFGEKDNQVYISTKGGKVWEWNWKKNETTMRFTSSDKILSMTIMHDFSKLIVGLSSGKIHLLNPQKNFESTILVNSPSGVEFLTVEPEGRFFAAGSADGTVKMYDLLAIQESPQSIVEHNSKLKALCFAGDRLWALTEDSYMHFWEKDYRVYAKELKKLLKRNFTLNEWVEYVGAVPYEKTIPLR